MNTIINYYQSIETYIIKPQLNQTVIYFILHVYIYQIQMQDIENRVLEVDLPHFFIAFKDNQLGYALYCLNTNNGLIMAIVVLIFIQLIRTAIMNSPRVEEKEDSTIEAKKLQKQFKDLKKQVKSIQTKLLELKNSVKGGSSRQSNPENGNNSQMNKVIKIVKEGWQKRESIALQIMDWQFKIIKEVTKLKNKLKGNKTTTKSSISKNSYSKSKIISNGQENHKSIAKETRTLAVNKQIQKPLFNGHKESEIIPKQITKPLTPKKNVPQPTIKNNANNSLPKNIPKANIAPKTIEKKEEMIRPTQQKVISTPYTHQQIQIQSVQVNKNGQTLHEKISFNEQNYQENIILQQPKMKQNHLNGHLNIQDNAGQSSHLSELNETQNIQAINYSQTNQVEYKPMKRLSPPKFTVPKVAAGVPGIKKEGKRNPPPPPRR